FPATARRSGPAYGGGSRNPFRSSSEPSPRRPAAAGARALSRLHRLHAHPRTVDPELERTGRHRKGVERVAAGGSRAPVVSRRRGHHRQLAAAARGMPAPQRTAGPAAAEGTEFSWWRVGATVPIGSGGFVRDAEPARLAGPFHALRGCLPLIPVVARCHR